MKRTLVMTGKKSKASCLPCVEGEKGASGTAERSRLLDIFDFWNLLRIQKPHAYRSFRKWIWINFGLHTRSHLSGIRREFLIECTIAYRSEFGTWSEIFGIEGLKDAKLF